MKKLLIALLALSATTAQAQEKEVFEKATAALNARRDSVYEEYLAMVLKRRPAPGAEQSQRDSLQTLFEVEKPQRDSLINLFTNIAVMASEECFTVMENLAVPYSDAFVDELYNTSRMILADPAHYGRLQERAEGLFAKLSPEQQASPDGHAIKISLYPFPATKVGDPLPSISLPDLDNTMHSMREGQGGKWLLVDFWSVGCGPCIESFPETHELLATNPNTLAVVSINIDGARYHKQWRQSSEQHNITWLNLGAEQHTELLNRMRVSGIPDYVLVAPDGIIAARWGGYGEGSTRYKLSEHIKELK